MISYDSIGNCYASRRHADPRITVAILDALGDATTILNVGAGTGLYEPRDRVVVAVEPSRVMAAQRPMEAAPVVRARAEDLPFTASSFDATLAVLTVHHWTAQLTGLRECRRVAIKRVVILTWDPQVTSFWLVEDYFPDLLAHDRRVFPSLELLERGLGAIEVRPVQVPADCRDGFLGAYWQRPEAYTDASVRAGMSSFARSAGVDAGVERLRRDLASGVWDEKYGSLRAELTRDLGYRLIIAEA